MNRIELRRLVIEALEEMSTCSECGAMYERGSEHMCSGHSEDELDEFSGAGAAGYTMPLGMRPPGPRRDSIMNVAHRSFGGLPGRHTKHKKRNKR
jgi:hypothetical protein